MKGNFKQPEIITDIPQHILNDLHANFPDQSIGTRWYKHLDPFTEQHRPELLEALMPLHELIMKSFFGKLKIKPAAIQYELETTETAPGDAQRPGSWHVDGPHHINPTALTVADVIPTEFLVRDSKRFSPIQALNRRQLAKNALGGVFREVPDVELSEMGLSIYQPDVLELVAMRGNVHRSPTNHSQEPIPRTWIRAVLFGNNTLAAADRKSFS